MFTRKFLNVLFSMMIMTSLLFAGSANVSAMPMNPTDETKVPHYFGPYPNWANSPFTLPDAQVVISGNGTGATAQATVGANGVVTGITITNPGSGYTAATVAINGAGTGASADAILNTSGSVTAVTVNPFGGGYTKPVVSFSGGGVPFVPASVSPAPINTYNVSVGSANGGTFTLTVDAATTAPIAWNALAADVQSALAGAGVSATVSGSAPWVITFAVAPASVTIDGALLTQTSAVLDASVAAAPTSTYNVSVGSATGGSFLLTVDTATAGPIAWNALAADVQTALANAGVSATVSGSAPWVITFAAAPASVTMDGALLTQGVVDASVAPTADPLIYNVSVGSATGGSFLLIVDALTAGPIAWNALAADVQAALAGAGVSATVSGSAPWVITFAAAPASVTMDGALLIRGVADASVAAAPTSNYNVSAGSANGGSFLLTVDTATAGPIAWNALAADVQAALAGAGVSATVSGSAPWVITFAVAPASVTMDSTLLTQTAAVLNASVAAAPLTTYNLSVGSATGGSFTLSVDAATTGAIAWNALAADVQTALAGAGVSATVSGSAPWVITFAVAPVSVTINPAGLTQPAIVAPTATAFGEVDALTLVSPGLGYHVPTVAFDLPDDPNGTMPTAHVVCLELNCSNPNPDGTPGEVTITGIVLDSPGSGYSSAPTVAILDGTQFDPIRPGGTGAIATATLRVTYVTLNTFGSGFVSAPTVTIADSAGGTGTGALATATIDFGGVIGIANLVGGSGYMTQGGIKKFQDGLPVLCIPTANFSECTAKDNNLGQHIPIAVPDTTTFSIANGFTADADYYVIAVVQHRERMSSSLPASGTLLREYVQLETPANASFSKHVALQTDLLDGTSVPTLMPDGSQAYAVDDPHFLGPVIVAARDRAVRIVFYNLLPTGSEGDLFLPTDSTIMGSGMGPTGMPDPADNGTVMDGVRNPMCSEYPKPADCFKDNRATLHLHGGVSPWISDGTPHQWITPANEATPWPQGVSVAAVPDMARPDLGVPDCSGTADGCMTFYYTNQQSARLMFYHDHAWGITRLNVYAGEAAGYLITDSTEQKLFGPNGPYASMGEGIPLVIQDRTFVPDAAQLAAQDPTWDATRWGGYGNLWYHHVYMPAQNPGDPGGMSAFGRWMYGPWFWPPATPIHGPIANPYYDPNCNLDNPATWQYQTDPFCEPQLIPGTPNISVGMEQFNDTPLVNGTAYPTTTVEPKSYRFRILNAANDRFWNLQWYVADPRTGTNSEVALNPVELAAAQNDPNVVPTPDTAWSPVGPSWIQIGTEGGFLPAPVVVPNQPITWITDPTRFDVGNVDKHALLLAPAERADVIVDFSQYAGKTLILYNDAPAAFPARVASYDYYTGAPDLSPVGAPSILPGYGPNTRTIMQVKVLGAPAPAFNLAALNAAFRHHADGSGVFESGQHPIIVGQAAYNSAYGTSFAASSWCNAPGSTSTRCDGFARISDQGGMLFGFNTLKAPNAKMQIPLQPKALHDEMNASAFDEFGRMTANIGLEAVPATPAAQNVILYPFVNPSTELIDATNLPKGDINVTAISSATDGTQIWKITHNGVDTHPIHFHLYDVQVLNRVTWDNIIIPTDANELGWKDTIRVSPLEDTIVALRPIIPTLPFELTNSIRLLSPMMPRYSTTQFNNVDPQGNPTAAIVNDLVNFGWEYVYHCHILSHEEMDMMRPVSVALPPNQPDGLAWSVSGTGRNTVLTLTWNDNSINETEFVIQRTDGTGTWVNLATVPSPLDQPNIHQLRSYADTTFRWNGTSYAYRVVGQNTIGYGGAFPSMTVQSTSASVAVIAAPSNLAASLLAGPQVSLTWMDNSANETGFIVQRSTDGVNFTQIGTAPAHNNTGITGFLDASVVLGTTYIYRVAAVNALGSSAYSNLASISVSVPADPANLSGAAARQGANERVTLSWTDVATNEAGYTVQRSTDPTFNTGVTTTTLAAGATTYTTGNITLTTWYFRVRAFNALGQSNWVSVTVPPAP